MIFVYSYTHINNSNFTINFINTNFIALYYFSLQKLKNYLILNIINNYIIISSALTYYIKLLIRISYYIKNNMFLLTKLDYYLIILNIK